jgi:hypothetical protein
MPLPGDLANSVAEMHELVGARHRDRIIALLQRIVPDYRPAEQQEARTSRQ